MTYIERLKLSAIEAGHIACLGLDPHVESLPDDYAEKGISGFVPYMERIYLEMTRRRIAPAAIKPNMAFYAVHNSPMARKRRWEGFNALSEIISISHEFFPNVPVILDVKLEDIGTTADAYAKACHDWDVDAVTVGPYLGEDSISAFLRNEEIGAYMLVLTSNKSSSNFQHLEVKRNDLYTDPLYMRVLNHGLTSAYALNSQLGGVVGATNVPLFRKVIEEIVSNGREFPTLIPGVGTQGGSAVEIMRSLREYKYDQRLARINASSSITHGWKSLPEYKNGGAPENAQVLAVDAFEELTVACTLL